jgi:hypothetical protein
MGARESFFIKTIKRRDILQKKPLFLYEFQTKKKEVFLQLRVKNNYYLEHFIDSIKFNSIQGKFYG